MRLLHQIDGRLDSVQAFEARTSAESVPGCLGLQLGHTSQEQIHCEEGEA
jgi:hypothetical protein